MMRRCLPAGLAATAVLWLGAGGKAQGAVPLGETFEPAGPPCFGTIVQAGSPDGQYTVPFPGVITSWSFQAPASAGPLPELKLKLARHAGGDNFTIVGEDGFRSLTPGRLNTFLAAVQAQPGDVLGLSFGPGGLRCLRSPAPGYSAAVTMGDVRPGATAVFFGGGSATQINVSAVLEPDCDSDGLGDDTQDSDVSSCPQPAKADGTLKLDASKGKVKKGRKVKLTGQYDAPGNPGCEAARSIEIQRRLKSQDDSAFKTFETAQTDAAGGFSAKAKVKKTYVYRGAIGETEACQQEVSNSEKVRAKGGGKR